MGDKDFVKELIGKAHEITMFSKTQTGMNNFPHGAPILSGPSDHNKTKTIYTDEISMIAETQTIMNNFTHGNSM